MMRLRSIFLTGAVLYLAGSLLTLADGHDITDDEASPESKIKVESLDDLPRMAYPG